MNVSKEADVAFMRELERIDLARHSRLLRNMRLSVKAASRIAQAKCQHCNLVLPSDIRSDSQYCDDACKKGCLSVKEGRVAVDKTPVLQGILQGGQDFTSDTPTKAENSRKSSVRRNRGNILPLIQRAKSQGGKMARTLYQHGEIVTNKGATHDSFMGRWWEDYRLPKGDIVRKKRAQVLGIVGEITEKQAKRKLEEILGRVNDPGYQPESSGTFQALAQEWGEQAFPEMKPSTVLNMTGHLRNHLLPFFGTMQVREITTRGIDKFFFKLSMSKKTKKNIFSTLKLIMKQGKAWGNVRENVWESAKKIGKSETEVRAYSDAKVENILSRSTGAVRLFYWLAVETGMRAGELCGLRVIDVDPFKKLVRVRQAVWRGRVQIPKTKNAIRDIPIPVEIVDALRVRTSAPERQASSSPRRTAHPGMMTLC